MDKVLFVDTNIYLDFYRIRSEMSHKFLTQLESLQSSIVMTYQVEMEFKKNRQAAILETLRSLKTPSPIPHPAILSEAVACQSLGKAHEELKKGVAGLTLQLREMLREPGSCDTVFTVLGRLFSKNDGLTLHETSLEKAQVVHQASERFLLGYPPRKNSDNSIGDAVNWEWLVQVASRKKLAVYIVSRDADYGAEWDHEYYLNDWLRDEFGRRAKKGASIHLIGRLSDALREFSVSVSKAQEKAERAIISGRRRAKVAEESGRYIDYLRSLKKEDLESEIDSKIADTIYLLLDDETMCSLMAETNAGPWDIDDYNILDIEFETESATVQIGFHATGEADLDRPFCGDKISGNAEATIDESGDVTYIVKDAEIEDWSK